jgi:IS5 family transposase
MHRTKKGNQYYFGAKAHIGVDSKEGVVHSVCTSAASVHDKHMLPGLLHSKEKKVWGDAGYQGQTEAIHEAAPQAQDMTKPSPGFAPVRRVVLPHLDASSITRRCAIAPTRKTTRGC